MLCLPFQAQILILGSGLSAGSSQFTLFQVDPHRRRTAKTHRLPLFLSGAIMEPMFPFCQPKNHSLLKPAFPCLMKGKPIHSEARRTHSHDRFSFAFASNLCPALTGWQRGWAFAKATDRPEWRGDRAAVAGSEGGLSSAQFRSRYPVPLARDGRELHSRFCNSLGPTKGSSVDRVLRVGARQPAVRTSRLRCICHAATNANHRGWIFFLWPLEGVNVFFPSFRRAQKYECPEPV